MYRRHVAKVVAVLGVALVAGCSTASTSWLPWAKPGETPRVKPTLPPFDQVLRVGELSKKQFAPGETVQMDVRLKGLALSGPVMMTVLWCDGNPSSKSIDTTQTRLIQHEPFPSPRDCWVEVELFDVDKVQVGDASVSFKIATESAATPTPAPAPPATPSVAPATPAPATPAPTLQPILPYRLPT